MYDESHYVMHTAAVMAARITYGLEPLPTFESAEQLHDWLDTGPHLVRGGRSYYVHAMGALQAGLGQAMANHPDWYLVRVLVRGKRARIAPGPELTLAEVSRRAQGLSLDEVREAFELTSQEKRRMWGVGLDVTDGKGE
jgi:hypothetical protein